jgi:CRP/FNR family transcriptional regulator
MADMKQIANFLAQVPLYKGVKRRQLESLAKTMVEQEYEAGEDIVTQGENGVGLFIIVSGRADAVHVRTDGSKAIVNTFGPTDFFGELALLAEGPRTASVVAQEATTCLVLTRWNFLAVLREDVEMAIAILEELAWRFRAAMAVL